MNQPALTPTPAAPVWPPVEPAASEDIKRPTWPEYRAHLDRINDTVKQLTRGAK